MTIKNRLSKAERKTRTERGQQPVAEVIIYDAGNLAPLATYQPGNKIFLPDNHRGDYEKPAKKN